ncbi:MAG: hypothetical protein NTU62_10735 [Spirochaetes bacterium]|nr:hypothetical protein [Spirochaetota bacterium]
MGRTSFALFAPPPETVDTIVTDAIGAEDLARLLLHCIGACPACGASSPLPVRVGLLRASLR